MSVSRAASYCIGQPACAAKPNLHPPTFLLRFHVRVLASICAVDRWRNWLAGPRIPTPFHLFSRSCLFFCEARPHGGSFKRRWTLSFRVDRTTSFLFCPPGWIQGLHSGIRRRVKTFRIWPRSRRNFCCIFTTYTSTLSPKYSRTESVQPVQPFTT